MNFKKSLLAILSIVSSFGWAQPATPLERPPRYPGPGNPRPEPRPTPRPEPRPEPRPTPRPEPRPEPRPTPRPEPRPEPRPTPRPEPRPEPRPTPRPEPRPEPRPTPRPEPRPEPRPTPRPEPRPEPRPTPRPEPRPEPRPTPRPEPRPEPRPTPRPEPRPEPRPTPRPEPRPTPRPEPRPTPPRPRPPGPIRPDPRPPVRPEPRPPRPYPRPRPRPPGPVRPHPQPYPPRPVRPLPPRPQPPVLVPNPGFYFSQFVNLNYVVSNQYLDLMQLLNLYQFNSDYTVESIVIRTNGVESSTMKLWVNDQVEDLVTWPSNIVSLYPRYDLRLGLELQNLLVQVDGSIYISQIEVRLRRVDYSGEYNQFHVSVDLDKDMYDYDVVELNDWINLDQYRGYRLIAVEVEASAFYAAEKMSLLIDNSINGEAYVVGEGAQITLFPMNSVILGTNAGRISLLANGGGALTLDRVTLRLSRY